MTASESMKAYGTTSRRIFLFALFLVSALPVRFDGAAATLRSRKNDLIIHLTVPPGWQGAPLHEWPSYETWSFAKTNGGKISYLQVRIDAITKPDLDWNIAAKEQIRKTFNDFTDPEVEHIASIVVDKSRVVVWAVFNVDGHLLCAEMRRGNLKVSLELRTERRAELRKLQKDFLDVLKSVRIDSQN